MKVKMICQENADLRLNVIGQIAVPVSGLDRAIAFYRDVLGMGFLFKAPPGLGFFDCNGVRLMLNVLGLPLAGDYTVCCNRSAS